MTTFHSIQREYLENWTFDYLRNQFQKQPDLYVGSFLEGRGLVGIAYGVVNEEKSAVLQGIAVRYSLWRKGIGSRLLRFFEEWVRKKGCRSVSLGSGEGPAEQFYLKNGYRPIEIKAKSEDGRVLSKENVYDYSDGLRKRELLRSNLKPKEVIFIMEKKF